MNVFVKNHSVLWIYVAMFIEVEIIVSTMFLNSLLWKAVKIFFITLFP